jgi:hypothetical protein
MHASIAYDESLDPDQLAFHRRYGPWDPLDPRQAAELFRPTGLTWWVAGGWAIEAFTGVTRAHEDIDVSMFRRDLPALRAALRERYHVWAAGSGCLCLLDEPGRAMPEWADQVWLREHALAPWRVDVVLNPDRDGRWVSRRERSFAAPLEDITFERAGIRYLNPEIALAFKAKAARPKDVADFEVALPLMSARARQFLSDYLSRMHPEHPWRERL